MNQFRQWQLMNHGKGYPIKTSPKVYLAGSWEQREKIRKWMDDLEKDGYTITEDWTRHEKQDETREYAEADKKGIENCDWFIYDAEGVSSGKNIELGMALMLKKPVFIIGTLNTVFHSLIPPANFFTDWKEFRAFLTLFKLY